MGATNPLESDSVADGLRRFVEVPIRLQTYQNLVYLALAFPLGMAYFVGITMGFSLGAGLLITIVGVPILLFTLVFVTALAGFEAALARRLLGIPTAAPSALWNSDARDAESDGILASLKRLLTAPTTWTGLVLVFVKFGYGILAFTALVTAGSIAVSTIGAPLFYDAPHASYQIGSYAIDTLPEAIALSIAGVLLTLLSLHLLNGLATIGGILTASLLDVGNDAEAKADAADD